jgi:hypothetical protein
MSSLRASPFATLPLPQAGSWSPQTDEYQVPFFEPATAFDAASAFKRPTAYEATSTNERTPHYDATGSHEHPTTHERAATYKRPTTHEIGKRKVAVVIGSRRIISPGASQVGPGHTAARPPYPVRALHPRLEFFHGHHVGRGESEDRERCFVDLFRRHREVFVGP